MNISFSLLLPIVVLTTVHSTLAAVGDNRHQQGPQHGAVIVHPEDGGAVVEPSYSENNDHVMVDESSSFGSTAPREIPSEKFVATHEWQDIRPGHIVPPGLHYRINLATGRKEAKLLEDSDEKTNEIPTKEGEEKLVTDKYMKLLRAKSGKFSASLEAIRDEQDEINEQEHKGKSEKVPTFRTIEKIKDEFKESNLAMKSETEILKQLLEKYRSRVTRKEITIHDKEKVALLLDMEESLHKIDVANDFVKLDGFNLIMPDLNSTDADVRAAVSLCLGSAMQNNLNVQQAALKAKLLPTLLRLITSDDSLLVKKRALYAVSCLIRNYQDAQKSFVNNGGVNALAGLFTQKKSSSVKLQSKVAALVTDILAEEVYRNENPGSDDSGLSEAFSSNDFCDHILTLLQTKDRDAMYAGLDAAAQILSSQWSCKYKIKERIDHLKDEAVSLLKSYKDDEKDLHSWVQELIGEPNTVSTTSHDEEL